MLGLLVNYKEVKEIEYVLKREMEEILHDIEEPRIDHIVKRAMEERYQILFNLFRKIASPSECTKYIRVKKVRRNGS